MDSQTEGQIKDNALQINPVQQIICEFCSEFVQEPLYVEHMMECSRLRNQELRKRLEAAERRATRLNRSVLSCSICYEEAAELKMNHIGLLDCGHSMCKLCYHRIELDPVSGQKICPTCRQTISKSPKRIFF